MECGFYSNRDGIVHWPVAGVDMTEDAIDSVAKFRITAREMKIWKWARSKDTSTLGSLVSRPPIT